MVNLLAGWFELFAAETGILGEIRQYKEIGVLLLAVLAVISCFLGIRSFRLMVATWAYIMVILLTCYLLRDRMEWGAVAVCFSIIGFVAAFLVYQWNVAGAVTTVTLVSITFACFGGLSTIWVILCGIVGGVLSIRYPGPAVCVATAAFGGVLLAYLLPVTGTALFLPAAALLSAGGLGLQLFLAKRRGLLHRKEMKKL